MKEVSRLVSRAHGAEIVHKGLRAVIFGRPNTGKSSLMNALGELLVHDLDIVMLSISLTSVAALESDSVGDNGTSGRGEYNNWRSNRSRSREKRKDCFEGFAVPGRRPSSTLGRHGKVLNYEWTLAVRESRSLLDCGSRTL